MAKGARNKKRQKAAAIRRKKFAPREAEKLRTVAPDLEKLRAETAAKQAREEEQTSMEDGTKATVENANDFDPSTKKNADGNYAPWLSGRDVKRLQKANNKVKNKAKSNKRASQKKMQKLLNTTAGREAVEAAKQRALDNAMKMWSEVCLLDTTHIFLS